MQIEPARMADMLTPLAQAHNEAQRTAHAAGKITRPAFLDSWDLLRLWLAVGAIGSAVASPALPGLEATIPAPASLEAIQAKAEVGTHKAVHGLRVLVQSGWLTRRETGRGDLFEQTIPVEGLNNLDFIGPAEPRTLSIMRSEGCRRGLGLAADAP